MSDFRDTPIGEVFEQVKHDLPLIQENVEKKEFDSALRGMDFKIEALTKLRGDMAKAFAAYQKYSSTSAQLLKKLRSHKWTSDYKEGVRELHHLTKK